MKKAIIQVAVVFILLFTIFLEAALAEGSNTADNNTLRSALSALNVTGGISAGYFYASNPGEDTSDDAFLLSNLLVEISSSDENIPIGFVGAFGETSTPSVLGTPENKTDFKIEYASLTVEPIKDIGIEAGLLQPNAGFENTYTFNNQNVILGAIASQQPYNAYGGRVGYDVSVISLWGGYYEQRLDDEEYDSPDYAWEIGFSTTIADIHLVLYNYHIKGQRNLLGAVIEHTIEYIDFAFNIDYWTWDNNMIELYGSESSIGAAFYICPNFDRLSIPIRLEYINQDESRIYTESSSAEQIHAATVSPTWHFNDNAYIRAESAYIHADEGFADKKGNERDSRINFAVEMGFLF